MPKAWVGLGAGGSAVICGSLIDTQEIECFYSCPQAYKCAQQMVRGIVLHTAQ